MIAVADSLKGRSFTRVADWRREELLEVLDLADELKRLQQAREEHHLLPGRTLGMIFQKPSTRTRVSFEVGIYQLGGTALYLSAGDLQLGRGETIKDTARVLSRYLDAIMIRTFEQSDVEDLSEHASIPVINGLTDSAHPCQALADAMTIRERFGRLEGLKVVYLGDGNNVCASLMVACAKLGMDFVAATPADYRPEQEAVRIAREAGGSVELVGDPRAAVEGAYGARDPVRSARCFRSATTSRRGRFRSSPSRSSPRMRSCGSGRSAALPRSSKTSRRTVTTRARCRARACPSRSADTSTPTTCPGTRARSRRCSCTEAGSTSSGTCSSSGSSGTTWKTRWARCGSCSGTSPRGSRQPPRRPSSRWTSGRRATRAFPTSARVARSPGCSVPTSSCCRAPAC